MAEEMAPKVSAKLRFECFKRDGFVCQYCGAHPPDVLLHADHVIPRSLGGPTRLDNLITACEPCNLGKGARPLSDLPEAFAAKIEFLAEREAQIRGYYALIEEQRRRLDTEADEVYALYDPFWTEFPARDRRDIVKFLGALGYPEVRDAMDAAAAKVDEGPCMRRWKYFCGICWSKIKARGPVGS